MNDNPEEEVVNFQRVMNWMGGMEIILETFYPRSKKLMI